VTDAKKSLNRNGKGGEDAPAHAGVGEWVDHVGEQDGEHVAVRLEGSEGVVESSGENEEGVEAGESHEEAVEAVA